MALRVVHLTALGISAKSFLIGHFRTLRRAGAEVILVCSDDPQATFAADAAGIRHVPIPIRQGVAPIADLCALFRLWRLFRRLRPDVIHAHMAKAGLLGMIAGWLARVPVRIQHNHGFAMLSATGLKRRLLCATDRLTHRLATHALFCSESTRNAGIKAGLVTDSQSWVLGRGSICGVDVERFSPNRDDLCRASVREGWGIGSDTIVVGYVGRLVTHKGIETLIQAWRRLEPDLRTQARLLLVGGDANSDPAMRSIVEAACRDDIGVQTLGWVEHMPECYVGLDMLVLPSWHEGFPYGILEAQSMGLPIVATSVTGNVDAVEHEVTGLLVPVRDSAALSEALSRLIRSAGERQRLGDQGRRRILEEFTQDQVLQRVLDFYREHITDSLKA